MEDKDKKKNDIEKTRPPYHWDEKLEKITKEVKKIIEKEETNGEDEK